MKTSKIFLSLIINVFILFISTGLHAQERQLKVVSFVHEENALTAKNEPVYDNNNQKCALVIIKGMGNEKLRFNTGGYTNIDEKIVDGERAYLFWISEGTVRVIISSDSKSFEPIEYYFNPRVKKAETYLMNLHLEELKNSIGKQFLEFIIEPKNASLEVNNELWVLSEGIAYRQLPKGKYQYQIKAKDYHTETGIVDFYDLSNKKSISINLKPNFGWLSINSSISEIAIFIDDEPYHGPFNRIKLSSGQHTIRAAKELYQTFTQHIVVEDDKETQIQIQLNPNFSTVTIIVDGGADIYLDDKLMGKNSWTGNLGTGNYKVELRKLNHASFTESISINNIGETLNFKYDELKPIIGSASIESTPAHANVKVDGVDYGTTPVLIPEIIIGHHNISLTLNGYNPYSATFEIKEGEDTKVNYVLEKQEIIQSPQTPISPKPQNNNLNNNSVDDNENNIINNQSVENGKKEIWISTNPTGASVYVDGNFRGTTPCKMYKDDRNHTLSLEKSGYSTISEYVNFSRDFSYELIKADEIMIYSYPPRAKIYLDNKFVGISPCTVKRDNRTHTLTIEKNGYFKVNEKISFTDKKYIIYNLVKIDEKTRSIYDPKVDDK